MALPGGMQGRAGSAAELVTSCALGQTYPSRTQGSGDICTSEIILGISGPELFSQWDFVMVRSVLEYVQ